MRVAGVSIFLLIFTVQLSYGKTIPEKFFGAWKVDKSENFDEYLSAKGVNWFVRKMIQMASVTKVLDKKEDGTYIIENRTSKGNTQWDGIHLGKQFEGKGMDGTMHKITFNYNNGILTEQHIRQYEGKEVKETYAYTVEDDQFVMKLTEGNIVARRWFKRVK